MISVIVPIYNSSPKLLNKCVESILSQTYKDFQLILVDDCSSAHQTIGCLKTIRVLDDRITLVTKEKNEGVDAARFTGIENSVGEWLAFVDSDDWLEKDALQRLFSFTNPDIDVVVGSHNEIYCGLKRKSVFEQICLDHKSLMEEYFVSFFGRNKLSVSMCWTLYRRKVIEKASLVPSGLKFGEDLVFNMQIIPYVRKMQIIPDVVYNYNRGLPGVSSKYMIGWLGNAVKLFEYKYGMLERYPNAECELIQAREMIQYLKSFAHMTLQFDKKNVDIYKKSLEECLESSVFKHLFVLERSNYLYKDVVKFILNKDTENTWLQLVNINKKRSLKRKVIDMISVFVRKIATFYDS